MNITTFEAVVHKTINIGNYESVKIGFGATINTTPETLENDKEELLEYLYSTMKKEADKFKPKDLRSQIRRPSVKVND